MKTLKKMIPYLFVTLLNFYMVPLLNQDTGSAMVTMLIIIPTICFLTSIIYGIKHSFHLSYSLIVCILFVPSIFIFYNISAWVYIVSYGVLSLFGNALGTLLHKGFYNLGV